MHLAALISLGLCSMAMAANPVSMISVTVSSDGVGEVPTTYDVSFTVSAAGALVAGNTITVAASNQATTNAIAVFTKSLAANNKVAVSTVAGGKTCETSEVTTNANGDTATITLKTAANTCSIANGATVRISLPSEALVANPTVGPPQASVTVRLQPTTTADTVTPPQNLGPGTSDYTTLTTVTSASITGSTTVAGAQLSSLTIKFRPNTALAGTDSVFVTSTTTTIIPASATGLSVTSDATGCTASGSTSANRRLTITLAGAQCNIPTTADSTLTVTSGLGTNPTVAGAVKFGISTTKDAGVKSVDGYTVTSGTFGRHMFSSFAVVAAFIMSLMHTMA